MVIDENFVSSVLKNLLTERNETISMLDDTSVDDNTETLKKLIASLINQLELLYIIISIPQEKQSTEFLPFKEKRT